MPIPSLFALTRSIQQMNGCERSLRPTIHRSELACVIAIGLIVGCGSPSGLPLAPVAGTVQYRNQPLTHGRVVFSPQAGTPGPQAVGDIQKDGSFRMRTVDHDGAAIGKHTVTVICRRPATPEEERNLVITELLIPPQYAREQDSPLQYEVKDEKNTCSLSLE